MNIVISVAHDKGGVGKTTIASNLLAYYVQQHGTVQAIDLDPKSHFARFISRRGDDRATLLHVNTAKELQSVLDHASGVIIMDIGGMDTDLTRFAIAYSDLVITPVADSQVEIDGLVDFTGVIRRLREIRGDLRATVLLNRVHPKATKAIDTLKAFAHERDELDIFDGVIRDRVAFKNAYAEAKGVIEYDPKSKAAQELQQILQEIEEKINGKV